LPGPLNSWIESIIEKATGLDTLHHLYHNLPASSCQLNFLHTVLELFRIGYRVNERGLNPIPDNGPVIVVANHSFGGLEGVILAHYLLQQRQDIKFMANYMLERVPELRDLFISVDPFGGEASRATKKRANDSMDSAACLTGEVPMLVCCRSSTSSRR
jgi:putative hemolysin